MEAIEYFALAMLIIMDLYLIYVAGGGDDDDEGTGGGGPMPG